MCRFTNSITSSMRLYAESFDSWGTLYAQHYNPVRGSCHTACSHCIGRALPECPAELHTRQAHTAGHADCSLAYAAAASCVRSNPGRAIFDMLCRCQSQSATSRRSYSSCRTAMWRPPRTLCSGPSTPRVATLLRMNSQRPCLLTCSSSTELLSCETGGAAAAVPASTCILAAAGYCRRARQLLQACMSKLLLLLLLQQVEASSSGPAGGAVSALGDSAAITSIRCSCPGLQILHSAEQLPRETDCSCTEWSKPLTGVCASEYRGRGSVRPGSTLSPVST